MKDRQQQCCQMHCHVLISHAGHLISHAGHLIVEHLEGWKSQGDVRFHEVWEHKDCGELCREGGVQRGRGRRERGGRGETVRLR